MTRFKKKRIIILTAMVIIFAGFIAVYANKRSLSNTVHPTTTGNTTKNQPANYDDTAAAPVKATPTPVSGVSKTATVAPQPLSKPTLQKSSGNAPGSSVPNGAAMEFTCEGTLNANCAVILTDHNNPNRIIALPAKPISSNGRGQYFATLSWTAITGSWTIQAKTSNTAGSSSASDTQSLEVK